ncbi:MAG: type II toxin-antitoxin system RelE/ParE family toxin [Cytophagales bacterium]|jgi:plasmid stabilization system protein ParE|nr:type II toxin-antitoxin system RelE/ParE family toxin [Cytophagales bacterium]
MAEKIIWSEAANADLEEIYFFLEDASPLYAQNWLNEVLDKVDLLESFPEMGRMIFEKEISFIREILVGHYRVVYSYLNGQITILKIKHTASPLGRI